MGRSARTLLSKKGREYRENAAAALLRQGHVMRNLEGPLEVHITAYPPDRRKRDLDNLPKSILDALTHAKVWGDDSQVDDLRITRGHIVKQGVVAITIAPMIGEGEQLMDIEPDMEDAFALSDTVILRQMKTESVMRADLIAVITETTNTPNGTDMLDAFALSLGKSDIDQFYGRRAGIWLQGLSRRFIDRCTREFMFGASTKG